MSPFLRDLLERTVRTFLQALLAVVVASGTNVYDVSMWQAAATAGLAAVFALLLGVVGGKVGDPNTASLLRSTTPDQEA